MATRKSTRVPRRIADEEPEPPARKRRKRATAATKPVQSQEVRHPRLGNEGKKWSEPKPPDIKRQKAAKKPPLSDCTIFLAMSPKAGNILRTLIGRANHDVPELYAIYNELEDQIHIQATKGK